MTPAALLDFAFRHHGEGHECAGHRDIAEGVVAQALIYYLKLLIRPAAMPRGPTVPWMSGRDKAKHKK
jgi:hypothetical protein